ncbi:MAG: hypothetical protein E2O65_01010 [Gammaproteobacteria bacterium]|nr:MAG: hypothetical protein E2O65_01010 [Gammaproteobacteria bacterium]
MARIAIGGFLHETNCFVPMRTGYEHYARGGDFPPLARGDEVIERTRGSSCGMSGFLDEKIDLGPTALLSIGGVDIVTASRRMQAFDQDIFKHIGVQPSAQKILVLKSTCHFRADFQPIAEAILIAVAPGAHLVDSTQHPFRHLRPGVRLSPMGPEFRPGKE